MANRAAKGKNLSSKGKTGPLTIRQRKKRGMKAKPAGSKTNKGKPSKKK